jgi:hypothetical protein
MSLRKFFGSLVPGFALVVLLDIQFRGTAEALAARYQIFQDRIFIYAIALVLSYLLGLLNIQIFFRLLDILGGWMDRSFARVKGAGLRKTLGFFSDRFHVFNLCTLADETKKYFGADDPAGKDEYSGPYWSARMAVVASSKALAKEAMEIEGDINFYAGMFLPLVWLGVLCRSSWPVATIMIFVALFFAVRFQHLRHDDIAFVASAAKSIHAQS